MAINFCSSAFGTTVSCSSVSADGYEPQNLLKPGAFGLWKGFLGEHFIKPPINITFTFAIEIDISCIVIDPKVGSQQTSGVEIFSATLPKVTSDRRSASGNTYPDVSHNSPESNIVLTNIGKGYCNSVSPRLILFSNRMYKSRFKEFPSPPLHLLDSPDVLSRDFHCRYPVCVRSVNKLVIRITRVQGGSVAALKKVEIWGQPAVSSDKAMVRKILENSKILQGLRKSSANGPVKGSKDGGHKALASTSMAAKEHTNMASSGSEGKNDSSPDCPEEFLDPITCSMMVIPILLPSGHTVDKETLDKHRDIEATWGRPPNDPFTGVPFSHVNKPIPNVKLKARIDKFLLSGGTAFQDVPRTSGRSEDLDSDGKTKGTRTSVLLQPEKKNVEVNKGINQTAEGVQISRVPSYETHLMQQGIVSDSGKSTASRKHKPGSSTGREDSKPAPKQPSRKRQILEMSMSQSMSPVEWIQGLEMPTKKARTVTEDLKPSFQSISGASKQVGHEKLVSDSLNDALASTLACLPSFSNSVLPKQETLQDEKAADICISCRTSIKDGDSHIYSIPCGHHICRNCTLQLKNKIVCNRCKREYKTGDLTRTHTR